MTDDILVAFWFLLPAALANAAPVIAARLPGVSGWNTRLDFDKKFRGKDIFGSHKTWRGLIAGIIVATIAAGTQYRVIEAGLLTITPTIETAYRQVPFVVLGPLLAIGALGGDAVESFFKRQRGTRPGQTWLPFDQLDYVIGAIIITLPFARFSLPQYVWMFAIWFTLHIITTCLGWMIGLKKRPI